MHHSELKMPYYNVIPEFELKLYTEFEVGGKEVKLKFKAVHVNIYFSPTDCLKWLLKTKLTVVGLFQLKWTVSS